MEKKEKPLKVLVYYTPPPSQNVQKKYTTICRISPDDSLIDQVNDLLKEAYKNIPKNVIIVVWGILGVKTVHHLESMIGKYKIIWYVPDSLYDNAQKKYNTKIKIKKHKELDVWLEK